MEYTVFFIEVIVSVSRKLLMSLLSAFNISDLKRMARLSKN